MDKHLHSHSPLAHSLAYSLAHSLAHSLIPLTHTFVQSLLRGWGSSIFQHSSHAFLQVGLSERVSGVSRESLILLKESITGEYRESIERILEERVSGERESNASIEKEYREHRGESRERGERESTKVCRGWHSASAVAGVDVSSLH